MEENPRTQAARDNDDRELIERASADAAAGIMPGSLGGIHGDIDREAEIAEELDGPDATVRPTKADDIANNQAYPGDRRGQNG